MIRLGKDVFFFCLAFGSFLLTAIWLCMTFFFVNTDPLADFLLFFETLIMIHGNDLLFFSYGHWLF